MVMEKIIKIKSRKKWMSGIGNGNMKKPLVSVIKDTLFILIINKVTCLCLNVYPSCTNYIKIPGCHPWTVRKSTFLLQILSLEPACIKGCALISVAFTQTRLLLPQAFEK